MDSFREYGSQFGISILGAGSNNRTIKAERKVTDNTPAWLITLRRYIFCAAAFHLLWELAHLPLYTIWQTGTTRELAFAAIHCTAGDILIAMSTMLISLFLIGDSAWPAQKSGAVLAVAIVLAVAYTIFSEWLNIVVREAWAYRDIMPVVPVINTGLSPILQWIVVPSAAYAFAMRAGRRSPERVGHEHG